MSEKARITLSTPTDVTTVAAWRLGFHPLSRDLEPIDPAPTQKALPEVTAERSTAEWATARVQEFHRDHLPLNDNDAAALLTALNDGDVYDAVMVGHTHQNRHSHVALWSDLTRRAPQDMRDNVSAFLALSAWLAGDGALAWVAIDLGSPRLLCKIVTTLLTEAVPPSAWDTIQGRLSAGE